MNQETNMTNGSDSTISTVTSGSVVADLISFAALSSVFLFLTGVFWCCIQHFVQEYHWEIGRRVSNFASTAIGIGMIVTPLTLVVGCVLYSQNGDAPGPSAIAIAGHVLLYLAWVMSLMLWIIWCAAATHRSYDSSKHYLAAVIICGYLPASTFTLLGVALLGWSDLEFDTLKVKGSNPAVTPGLRTAGVVISSVCLSIVLVTLVCMVAFITYKSCMKKCIMDARDGARRNKQIKKDTKSRLQKSKTLLEEALKHGSADCRTVVCLLVGVAGAGKTHTKHLLFRWAPPDFRNSTPLAARPVQAIRVLPSEEGGELHEVDPDQLDEILASAVATGVSLENTTYIRTLCCNRKTESIGIAPSFGQLHLPSSKSTSNKDRGCYCCNGSNSDLLDTVKSTLDKTTRRIATSKVEEQLNRDWIYLIDSGGQIEFLEALPAFLQHTSVCLFVTKLSEELINHPKIAYFEDGMPLGEPTLCPFTNEEMIMRCVQTIQTQCTHHGGTTKKGSEQSEEHSTNQGSKLVMVGTHRDLEYQCKERRKDKNERLRSKLCPQFDKSLVFHGLNMEELVFPINANNPGPEDHEVANKITKVIFDVASSLEPRKTPISWFKFEQLIQILVRNHGYRILHWKECLQIARLLHLSAKDLDAALDHLASFGVIHYYWKLLPNIVFVDPQLLLDKISELVKHHYLLRHTLNPKTAAIGGEWREFRNEGCITLEMLKKFPKHYTDIFTPADFLKLLNDRLIVTQFIGIKKYFMPCLLRTIESQEIDQYRTTSSASGVAPLAIHFSCKLVPHGVFCSLVAFLRSQSFPWSLSLCPEDETKPLCLTRNCIKFQLPEGAPGSLTLIDAFSHFEVYVNSRPEICVRLCPSIWHTLVEAIQKAAETLNYSKLFPKLAFLCKHENTRPHLAYPADAFDYWKCELNQDKSGPLTNEHKVWKGLLGDQAPGKEVHISLETFSEDGGLQAPTTKVRIAPELHSEVKEDLPTVLECTRFQGRERRINIPREIGTNYYYFGLHLLDDPNGTRIRNLELEYRQNAERINTEILQEWATGRGKKPVNWQTLTTVLGDIERHVLASEIKAVKLASTTSL